MFLYSRAWVNSVRDDRVHLTLPWGAEVRRIFQNHYRAIPPFPQRPFPGAVTAHRPPGALARSSPFPPLPRRGSRDGRAARVTSAVTWPAGAISGAPGARSRRRPPPSSRARPRPRPAERRPCAPTWPGGCWRRPRCSVRGDTGGLCARRGGGGVAAAWGRPRGRWTRHL